MVLWNVKCPLILRVNIRLVVVIFSALNNSEPSRLSLVDCDSSTFDLLIGVIVAIATLLAVAVVALAAMLHKIRRLKLQAASEVK